MTPAAPAIVFTTVFSESNIANPNVKSKTAIAIQIFIFFNDDYIHPVINIHNTKNKLRNLILLFMPIFIPY